jgi:hypothetical protein
VDVHYHFMKTPQVPVGFAAEFRRRFLLASLLNSMM